MEEKPSSDGQAPATDAPVATSDLVLELNFVPAWARKPPIRHQISAHPERVERPEPRGRGRNARTDRPRRPPPRRREERAVRAPPPPAPAEIPRAEIRFLPERRHLIAVVRQLNASMKSYPLRDLAYLFFSNPAFCEVMIELDTDGTPPTPIKQCKTCRMAGFDRAIVVSHVLKAHIEEYFDKEEVVTDPPSGRFVFVARCGLSGTLLGPPNHHSFGEKVLEVYRSRYSHMHLEEYKKRIETVNDPDLIEKWKEESRKQTVYRLKNAGEKKAESMKLAAAEAHMAQNVVPGLIIETRKAVMPLEVACRMEDPGLRRLFKDAADKESEHPLSLMFCLRGAFRNLDLYVFKAGRGMDFVTSVKPSPLDPKIAIEPIREVLLHLQKHPGCTRKRLLEVLRPGKAPDTPEASEVLMPLKWLVEKGHIIEFFNGTLAVPLKIRTMAQRR